MFLLEDPGEGSGLVSVFGKSVPATEYKFLRPGQGNEILYLRDPVVGALAKAYGLKLHQRTHRPSEALIYELDARYKGRRHRTHTRHQYASLPSGFLFSLASVMILSFPTRLGTRPNAR